MLVFCNHFQGFYWWVKWALETTTSICWTAVLGISCSLESVSPHAFMHLASGEGGIERVEMRLHGRVPGAKKWKKSMFKRRVLLSQRFRLLNNRQHCEASRGRRFLVVVLSMLPCCESLWIQVQRDWYQGKSIEIITLKNQKREGRKEGKSRTASP